MEVKLRSEIADEFKWNLSHIYSCLDELDVDYKNIEESIKNIIGFKNISKHEKEIQK